MVPLTFDRSRIQALLELAGERLEGEWRLIGGGAAAAWFAPGRTTEDFALIGLGGTQAERFALMELASAAAIPIDAVNSAADFFVRRIDGWREQLTGSIAGRERRFIGRMRRCFCCSRSGDSVLSISRTASRS